MSNWKYTSDKKDVVYYINPEGNMISAFVTSEEVKIYLAQGGKIDEPDTIMPDPVPTKQELTQKLAVLTAQVAALPDDQAT